jgi:hypothetical protein
MVYAYVNTSVVVAPGIVETRRTFEQLQGIVQAR